MTVSSPMANPKSKRSDGRGRAHWYPYYAGYSPEFVSDVLAEMSLGPDALVLDPWNGSGTTTTVCSINGVRSTGYDLNPSMIVVAKARLLDSNTSASLQPLLATIVNVAKSTGTRRKYDPLTAWFNPGTADRLRALELAIQGVLAERPVTTPTSMVDVGGLSSLAAFYYVLLFRFVRSTLRSMNTSNPTWLKSGALPDEKVSLSWADIAQGLLSDLQRIRLLDSSNELPRRYAAATLSVADSRNIPLGDGAVDAVITSPPYCTRIDYAVATRAELAVLNATHDDSFIELRRQMLGTTLTNQNEDASLDLVTGRARTLLEAIRSHTSKASAGYYFNTFSDYFQKLDSSLRQIGRVVKPGGFASLVVQDSSYKDLHIDLAQIVSESLETHGFIATSRWDFPVARSLRQIHARAKSHRGQWMPTESILLLRKK
jgi:DNA modification methylase